MRVTKVGILLKKNFNLILTKHHLHPLEMHADCWLVQTHYVSDWRLHSIPSSENGILSLRFVLLMNSVSNFTRFRTDPSVCSGFHSHRKIQNQVSSHWKTPAHIYLFHHTENARISAWECDGFWLRSCKGREAQSAMLWKYNGAKLRSLVMFTLTEWLLNGLGMSLPREMISVLSRSSPI